MWTCGFEFEGFGESGILGIVRPTVDSGGGKAFIEHICGSHLFTFVLVVFTFVLVVFTFVVVVFTFVVIVFTFVVIVFTFVMIVFTFLLVVFTFVLIVFTFVTKYKRKEKQNNKYKDVMELLLKETQADWLVTGLLLRYYSITSRMITITVQSGAHCEHYQAIICSTASLPIATPA